MMVKKGIPKSNEELNLFLTKERPKALRFLCGRYKVSRNDAEDIFQDSCLALFRNIKEGKLVTLTSTLSTYFTKICVNQTLKWLGREKEIISIDSNPPFVSSLISDDDFPPGVQQAMEDIIKHLPNPCDTILWAFYYDNRNMRDIATLIGFKNADSAKAKKSQCLTKLKKRFTNKIKGLLLNK